MIQQFLVKLLLSPLSLLYGIGVSIRLLLYRIGILKSIKFDLPTIAVGNLSIGGAGKSPHIEYLVRLLREYINVATLSRGYQRKTKGYLEVQRNNTATEVGDEPLQFKRKFPEVVVAVSESRTLAIPQIVSTYPNVQCILLDDAFQHLPVDPGLNILLTEYSKPFTRDWLLPSGRLREPRSGYHRADIIVVSKCPQELTLEDRIKLTKELNLYSHQQIFFSYYKYQQPYYIFQNKYRALLTQEVDVLLICAIAGSKYLIEYLEKKVGSVASLEYEDHHYFNKSDLGNLKRRYDAMDDEKKVIITTEKDAMRLAEHSEFLTKQKLPVFVLPIEVTFHDEDGDRFNNYIKDYLLKFKV